MIVFFLNYYNLRNAEGVSNLASLIERVPELQEKKKRIDLNMNIATAVLNQVKVLIFVYLVWKI